MSDYFGDSGGYYATVPYNADLQVTDETRILTVAEVRDAPRWADSDRIAVNGNDAPRVWQAVDQRLDLPVQDVSATMNFLVDDHHSLSVYTGRGPFTVDPAPVLDTGLFAFDDAHDDIVVLLRNPYYLVIVLLALLLTVSIVTPVFAVAARRQIRQIGLLESQGASPSQIHGTLLWQGGLVALCGALISLPLSWLFAMIRVRQKTGEWMTVIWHVDTVLLWVVAASIVGLLAALLPALSAARVNPVVALHSGGVKRTPTFRWPMIIGPVITVLSLIAVYVAQTRRADELLSGAAYLIPFFWFCTAIGLVCSGWLFVWTAAKLVRLRSVTAQLALRDAWRNISRTGPAVSAIAGVTFCATVYALFTPPGASGFTSSSTISENSVVARVESTDVSTSDMLWKDELDSVGRDLHAANSAPHYWLSTDNTSMEQNLALITAAQDKESLDPYNSDNAFGWHKQIVVIPADAAFVLANDRQEQDRLEAVLKSGKALATSPLYINDGVVRLYRASHPVATDSLTMNYIEAIDSYIFDREDEKELPKPIRLSSERTDSQGWTTYTERAMVGEKPHQSGSDDITARKPLRVTSDERFFMPNDFVKSARTYDLPAELVPGYSHSGLVFITPETATSIGLQYDFGGRVYQLDKPVGLFAYMRVAENRGPHSSIDHISYANAWVIDVVTYFIPIVMVWVVAYVVIALILGLAGAEARRNMAVVSAIGADPRVTHRFLAHQGALVGVIGAAPGALLGTLAVATMLPKAGDFGASWGFWLLAIGGCTLLVPVVAWLTGLAMGRFLKPDIELLRED